MKQIVLLSDTHHTLDERFFPHFEKADEIWHAGDIGDLSITDKLAFQTKKILTNMNEFICNYIF